MPHTKNAKNIFHVGEEAVWMTGEEEKVVTVTGIVAQFITVFTKQGQMIEFMESKGRHVGVGITGHLDKSLIPPRKPTLFARIKHRLR